MPFGLGVGESIVTLLVVVLMYALPMTATVWAVVTLVRLRRGQGDILTRLAAIERKLGGRS